MAGFCSSWRRSITRLSSKMLHHCLAMDLADCNVLLYSIYLQQYSFRFACWQLQLQQRCFVVVMVFNGSRVSYALL